MAAGAPGQAAAFLGEALAQWRGAPLAEVSDELFAQAEIARLNELRAGVIEDRIEADLALGRHGDVVSELEALIAVHPLRERLYQQLIIALYRCGRQAEALAVYRSARRVLMQELGIEPGPGLKRLERAILEQDVSLEHPARHPEPSAIASTGRERPLSAGTAHRAQLLSAAGAVLAVTLALLVGGSQGPRGSGAPVSAGPDTVAVIDGSQDILSTVVTGTGRPGGAAHGAGATWITDTADDLLLHVDQAGQVVDRIPVGRGPGGVAVAAGEIWVANQLDGTVSEVNPTAGAVVATIGVGNGPDAVASGYQSVWVATVTDGTLSRIDPGSGRVLATIPLGGTPAGLAAGDRGIWVTRPDTGQLLLVDPRANRVSRVFQVGGSPGGVAVGMGSVWVSDPGGAVARVDPATGRVQEIRTGGSPDGITYAGGAVWVADGQGGSVARIDPRTGKARVHPRREPASCAGARGRWRAGDGAAIARQPPRRHPHADRTAIAARPDHRSSRRLDASDLADAERDQRRAGRLPPHRRAGATRSSPISRQHSPRRPTAAGPSPSIYAPASSTPTGHRSGRKTSATRSNGSSPSAPARPPTTQASSAPASASGRRVAAISRAASSPTTRRARSPSISPPRTRSSCTSSPSPSPTRSRKERLITRSARPSSRQPGPT